MSSLPSAVRVMVTKVRTGGSDEGFVVVEDAVGDEVEMTNVGGWEKELVEDSVAVLTADKDDVVDIAVGRESLRIMNDTAEISIVGFG